MYIFICEESFEAMMTCIYEAWASRLGHKNIRLSLESSLQTELFCEYHPVTPDSEKARRVISSIQAKISPRAYSQVYLAAMNDAPERLDLIYRFLLLGFSYGSQVTDLLQNPYVLKLSQLAAATSREACYFREFTRFSCLSGDIYVSHIEPRCNILSLSSEHFQDRMPSEHWMIIDDKRLLAAVHPKDQPFYLTKLTEEELQQLQQTEKQSDLYTGLWKEYFTSIAIKERTNPLCQRSLLPLHYRKHMTEFLSQFRTP